MLDLHFEPADLPPDLKPYAIPVGDMTLGLNESSCLLRLIHSWNEQHSSLTNTIFPIHTLWIDVDGSRIQGYTEASHAAVVSPLLMVGRIYRIVDPFLIGAYANFRTCPHRFSLWLLPEHVAQPVYDDSTRPYFPRDAFSILPSNTIRHLTSSSNISSDFVGRLVSITDPINRYEHGLSFQILVDELGLDWHYFQDFLSNSRIQSSRNYCISVLLYAFSLPLRQQILQIQTTAFRARQHLAYFLHRLTSHFDHTLIVSRTIIFMFGWQALLHPAASHMSAAAFRENLLLLRFLPSHLYLLTQIKQLGLSSELLQSRTKLAPLLHLVPYLNLKSSHIAPMQLRQHICYLPAHLPPCFSSISHVNMTLFLKICNSKPWRVSQIYSLFLN
ncbi:hypothetical protein LINGRAHAP2_LOCUS10697 [Linum grandiflorum]